MKPWSLQSRVASISTLAICTGVAFGSIGMYQAAAIEDDQVIDERAQKLAAGILNSAIANRVALGELVSLPAFHPIEEAAGVGFDRYQIWLKNGTQLVRSYNASTTEPLIPFKVLGPTHLKIDSNMYCAYAAATENQDIIVQVALREPERAIAIGVLGSYFLPLILIPLLIILYVNRMFLRRTFQSLDAMVKGLELRDPYDTLELSVDRPSSEMIPIIKSLDAHIRHVGRAMSAEHRFTSFAAHELRTPLAGIRAQAQLAAQTTEPGQTREALQLVMQGVDKAARVIDQLIDLNHIEGMSEEVPSNKLPVSLTSVVQQILEEIDRRIKVRGLQITTSLEVTELQGIEFAIYLMLRNLLANAILYTPQGGRIEILTRRHDGLVTITVDDSGKGIEPSERKRAFQKFDRLGRSGTEGVGLGLSIVAHAVKLHGAKIELLDSPLGGLRAQVTFR